MEETKKYYWLHVKWVTRNDSKFEMGWVIDVHPFIAVDTLIKKHPDMGYMLTNYKQIDVTEYNLWNELNNK